jgi:hypothetical protein
MGKMERLEKCMKVRENALSVLKSARKCTKRAETCDFFQLFASFFDFFRFFRMSVRAWAREGQRTGILYVVCHGGTEHYEKISKIPIFRVGGDADLIDFNRFGEVVSRRAGIIRLIDLALEDGPVDTIVAGKKENLMWREVLG